MKIETPSQITLGSRYRDTVTKTEGTAIGITEWLTGCATVGLAREVQEDGKIPEVVWFDCIRLELVSEWNGFAKPAPHETKGGPAPTPQKGY